MYDKISDKIKASALVLAIIESIVSVIAGITILRNDSDMAFLCIVLVIVAPIVAFLFSFLIYGFGELIEKVNYIADNIDGREEISVNEIRQKIARAHSQNFIDKLSDDL